MNQRLGNAVYTRKSFKELFAYGKLYDVNNTFLNPM